MSEALELLRSYARLVGQMSGAGCVTVYVPAGPSSEGELLLSEGALAPVPELADEPAAAELRRSHDAAGGPLRLASRAAGGALFRIPLPGVTREEGPGVERRRRGRTRASGGDLWLGLRFEAARERADAQPTAGALRDEAAWTALLGLGAAFALHTREASRRLLDQVTGLPERREFQAELDAALAHGAGTGRPLVLLLLGPDDFGWVNERFDRRSGDKVLREIATGLRSALRRQDQVARYGGATFTVVLRDAVIEEGRRAAENVVGRLAEGRYHQRLLRLEFSAGLASWDPAEPIDAHELVRRADQALSAAKRGQGGNIRVWERGSDVEQARSLDRLQGIFTGDKSKDYRNMRLLLDAVAVVAASTDPAELALRFSERLFGPLHARRVAVLELNRSGGFELLAGLERSASGVVGLRAVSGEDLALVGGACREQKAVSESREPPGERVSCAMPLLLQERCLGAILLELGAGSFSLEGPDRWFLDALAAEMAVALDRARLIERERTRERLEREQLEAEVHDLRRVLHGSRLAYGSPQMESLLAAARKVARTDTTVLITGETGTGKEMLAHTLHELSSRHERPLVVVDCSAISPTLIESELFGHEKGAFTGAHARNPGRLALAHGSTVFLDEIGDLPLDLQSKLLRFVQDRQFTPVGGTAPRTVDTRIIAATNVELRARVAAGRFREDLFHRLNVVRLHVPALRERREDVLHLAKLFLKQFAALYRRPAHRLTEAAELALEAYRWPGNVRELQNVMLTSVLFSDGPEVDLADLQLPGSAALPQGMEARGQAPATVREKTAGNDPVGRLRQALAREVAAVVEAGQPPVPLGKWLSEDLVLTAERIAGGTHRRAASLLGLPETTYRRQLQGIRRRRAADLGTRTPTWPAVVASLEDLIHSRPSEQDLCAWAEACLLAEIDSAAPGDVRTAAALAGVTEPTVLRRQARLRRS